MPTWLEWISNVLPASYALEALQQVGAHTELTGVAVRDIAIVLGFAIAALCLAAATLRRRTPVTATNAGRKRPGRPAGSSNTRERILASARELFARNGISNTSIRAVAAAAGVDSALVHHYFGTKEQLFAAAVHIPIDPMDVIGPLREVPVEELGHRHTVNVVAAVGLRGRRELHRHAAVDPGGLARSTCSGPSSRT